ncbi:MAG TPA: DUF1553 domain-containing protein [Verrucomicrobiales bacterium]|nr:DUF1553 domain-containing protein [Verrucomicrobiales bacterium]
MRSLIRVLRQGLAAGVVLAGGDGFADERRDRAPTPVFEHDVRPILKAHCFHCHGEGEEIENGVDLRLRRFIVHAHTETGERVVTPGVAAESALLRLIRSGDMPKGEKKLSAQEAATIEAWISAGAPAARPEPESLSAGFYLTEEERTFWSFQPVRRPPAPFSTAAAPESKRAPNPIDAFVQTRMQEAGLIAAPEADRRTLARRTYLNLLGFPPEPEDVERFLSDFRTDAYERLVDRLLASPAYGERWGRHWLDVAGYADSNGYAEADSVRDHAWRYRDYVIRAFNEDKPWDEFIIEQLAGDELAEATHENAAERMRDPTARQQLIATGFLRLAPDGTGDGEADQNLARNQVVAETVNIVSSSLLGLTVGCAQCHDHRYDPVSQADYYALRAIFEPGFDWKHWRNPEGRLVSLFSDEDRVQAGSIEAEARRIDAAAEQLRRELLDAVFEKELAKLPENLREMARVARITPASERSAEQRELFTLYPSADVQGALDLYDPEANAKVGEKQGEAAVLRATKPREPKAMVLTERAADPPASFVFHRGDHDDPRQEVQPADLEVLRGPEEGRIAVRDETLASSGRRLAYAKRLTGGEHPLVPRVLVNRMWLHHFGRGIVASPGDFGALGDAPSHPGLLDWLASEFVEGGWRLKSLQRLILTSQAYRQSADNPASAEADTENRYLARWKPRRLEAESVRDSILAASGSLQRRLYGEPVPVAQDDAGRVVTGNQQRDARGDPTLVGSIGEEAHRRSVYVQVRRTLPLTVLEAFDAPVLAPNCEMRSVSVAPSQALTLLNDSFVAEQSLRFADRLMARTGQAGTSARVREAWMIAFGDEPSPEELRRAEEYLTAQSAQFRQHFAGNEESPAADRSTNDEKADRLALATLCQALLGSSRFLYIE